MKYSSVVTFLILEEKVISANATRQSPSKCRGSESALRKHAILLFWYVCIEPVDSK